MKTLVVFGTRPEAIKFAPVVRALKADPRFEVIVCVTGQHREMLRQVLDVFQIEPEIDLDVMAPNQSLSDLTAVLVREISRVVERVKPEIVLVHGDTTTTLSASLAAYYNHVPVAHVEAGLRTGNIYSPWPEEINRKVAASIASLHFCPTDNAQKNLLKEGVEPKSVHVTGNTVIDALLLARDKIRNGHEIQARMKSSYPYLDDGRPMLLITGHRRESFGEGFRKICLAIQKVAKENESLQVVYPVHMNPNVRGPVFEMLSGLPNVFLIDPVDYLSFVYLMDRCSLILTDSGGIQEEAPSLGVPVLVMRETTERPEAIDAGVSELVGTDADQICSAIRRRLALTSRKQSGGVHKNPYGDGSASLRIRDILLKYSKESRQKVGG